MNRPVWTKGTTGRNPSFFLGKKKEAKKNLFEEADRIGFEVFNPLCGKSNERLLVNKF